MLPNELLTSLKNFNLWNVALKTYANDHCTLIGLIVSWWISSNFERKSALEGGPEHSDAVLLEDNQAKGILEVEGGHHGSLRDYNLKFKRFREFFENEDYRSLDFCILFTYPTKPDCSIPEDHIRERAIELSRSYPEKIIIIMTLHKMHENNLNGIRAKKKKYYGRSPTKIEAYIVRKGSIEIQKTTIIEKIR